MSRSLRLSLEPAEKESDAKARSPEPVTPESSALTPSTLLRLQQGAGNAVVSRLVTVRGKELTAKRITRQSSYKRRLNSIISREARAAGVTPDAVRRELVVMTGQGTHAFDGPAAAVRAAVQRITKPLSVKERVERALEGLTGADLSQAVILNRLETAFHGKRALHRISKDPECVEALLEAIRGRQSRTWKEKTEIHQVGPKAWTNDELRLWSARHYTNKFQVVLGEDLDDGTFAIKEVLPPPFMELLSSITLSTMDRADPAPVEGYATGSKLLRTYSSGAASSGHTTGPDWQHIGNVGDTFFGLFYNGSPATGKVPNFIRDAVYYAEWPASEFGSAWASADWLATASQSQVEGAPTPGGKARQGELPDIIADIFPAAATRGPGDERGDDEATNETARKDAFGAMENFEVKKHGPMAIKEWLPQEKTVAEIKKWSVDGKTGALVKLKTKIERKELTRGAQLLGAGRGLELVDYDYEKDIYSFAGRTFSAPELDEEGSTLYAQLERAVAEEREKRESEAITQTSSAPPPPPGLGPPPVSSSGSKKKPASGGDKKLPH